MDVLQCEAVADAPKPVRRRVKKVKPMVVEEKKSAKPMKSGEAGDELEGGCEPKSKPEAKKLKKKLLDITEVNETLTKALNDKNQEIADLKRSVLSLNEVLNSVPIDELRCNSSIASTKILELSKKNRQMRAELETSKNRLSKKDVLMQKLERELRLTTEKYRKLKESADKNSDKKPVAVNEEALTKIATLQQKVFEGRNKISELQTQLKLAHKCIQQEVGEFVNLNTLASDKSSWRGRAQQILHLQQRVHELKERLDASERQAGGGAAAAGGGAVLIGMSRLGGYAGDQPSTDDGSVASGREASSSCEVHSTTSSVGAPAVRRNELQHRAKVEKLEKEIAGLRGQLEEARHKIVGLKVRSKTINDELLKYKMKASTLEEQTDYNGINLDRLNDELNAQKQGYEVRLQQMSRLLEVEQRQQQEYQFKIEQLNDQNDSLQAVIKQKEKLIADYEHSNEQLQADMKALVGDFLFSCRHFRREEFMALLDALEQEKTSLMEHNSELQNRLDVERDKTDTFGEMVCRSKLRLARTEAKLRELEKELDAQADRRKRSQRMTEYANSISASSSVGSFVFENNSAHKPRADVESSREYIDLRHQLEYANEKIAMLEDRLTNLMEEKHADYQKFKNVLYSTKDMILNTINGNKMQKEPAPGEQGTGAEFDVDLMQYQSHEMSQSDEKQSNITSPLSTSSSKKQH